MSELLGYEAPFEDLGIGNDQYMSLSDLEGTKVSFISAKAFENDKGPGVYIAFRIGDAYGYTTTHSKPLMDVFTSQGVLEAFAKGDEIVGTLKQKVSRKSGYKYYMVE